ncbi:hypothetical protein IU405_08125 [Polaribacter sp. BAL334]|uniref:hypothetical protein n=1 Tax=Polaribacter sp. BAL334 TaxID=1708178 RepID=UPI0018D24750|nr:hypothetical protein [Polaribacter sp. BAL334]MBG7612211.1 hypothetical protein [Polaribacter sp. BAL334]
MENHNLQKEIDAFASKYIKEIEIESPSLNFTATLMKKIEANQKKVLNQEPLISKKGWFGIFSVIFIVLLFSSKTKENSVFEMPKLNFSFIPSLKINQIFETLSISNTTLIAFLLFGGMLLFQLFYLKNYFDKRFE